MLVQLTGCGKFKFWTNNFCRWWRWRGFVPGDGGMVVQVVEVEFIHLEVHLEAQEIPQCPPQGIMVDWF